MEDSAAPPFLLYHEAPTDANWNATTKSFDHNFIVDWLTWNPGEHFVQACFTHVLKHSTASPPLVLDVGASALEVFKDPATGAPRLACASGKKVLVFDPVAGGDALLVLDIGSEVKALAVFKEPATSAPRLACGSDDGKVRVFDAVSGGDALLVLDIGSEVDALLVFEDLATGALRLASGSSDGKVRVFDPVAGGEALLVIDVGKSVIALEVFADSATGAPAAHASKAAIRSDVLRMSLKRKRMDFDP